MKQIGLLIVLVGTCIMVHAQNVIYMEDFEGGSVSTTWVNSDLNTSTLPGYSHVDSAWIVKPEGYYAFGNAGISPPAPNNIVTSTAWYTPTAYADDWMLTPQMTIPANCYLVWRTRGFIPYLTFASLNTYEVLLSTTGTNLNDYGTQLFYEQWPAYEWSHQYVDLSAYAGQTISLAFRNISVNAYLLGVDDIGIIQLENYDMAALDIDTRMAVKKNENQVIEGTFRNYGNQVVTQMDVNYQVNGGAIVTETLTGLSIAPMATHDVMYSTPWQPTNSGTATVDIWASNINGQPDMINSNDVASKTIEVYDDMTLLRPLYEDLSSKECGPCKSWNNVIYPIVRDDWNANLPHGNISAIYYQMHFPGTADPSNNSDAYARWAYYDYQGTPQNYVDGDTTMTKTLFDADFNTPATYIDYEYGETPSFLEMDVSGTYTGNTVNVTVDVNPLKNISSSNLKLRIAVVEAHYIDVPGFNGETEFYYVMRKMLPDANGTSLSPLTQYNAVQVNESYTFTVGNVTAGSFNLWEGMHNTQVVAFVQDDDTKEVLQSAILEDWVVGIEDAAEMPVRLYPNPANQRLFAEVSGGLTATVLNVSGSIVSEPVESTGNGAFTLDVSGLSPGTYILRVIGEAGVAHETFVVE